MGQTTMSVFWGSWIRETLHGCGSRMLLLFPPHTQTNEKSIIRIFWATIGNSHEVSFWTMFHFFWESFFFWRQGIDKGEKTHLSESLSTCHIRGCEWMLWNFAELARGLIFSPLRIFILYQRVVSNSLCCRILQRLFSHFLTTDGWLPRENT